MKLKIDSDFKRIIPPLSPDEFKQLEDNILSTNHCRDPIITWGNIIVDGHNRYEICQKHGIAFEVAKIHFASKDAALLWIVENQLGRRNLNDAMRIEMAYRMTKMLKGRVHVRKTVAKTAGVSERQVQKYMKIIKMAEPELIEQVRNGDVKIGNAFDRVMLQTRTVRKIYDSRSARAGDPLLCFGNLLGRICGIERFYGLLDEVVSLGGIGDDVGEVEGKLVQQLGVLEGQLSNNK